MSNENDPSIPHAPQPSRDQEGDARPSLAAQGVAEALREAIAAGVREPNEQFAYHRCNHCDATWWGDRPGRANPDKPRHRTDCVIPRWEAALWQWKRMQT